MLLERVGKEPIVEEEEVEEEEPREVETVHIKSSMSHDEIHDRLTHPWKYKK
jgi:hypothetical protein